MSTNSTRRFPRTMAEAFGPHTDNVLHPMPERRKDRDRAAVALKLYRRASRAGRRLVERIAGH